MLSILIAILMQLGIIANEQGFNHLNAEQKQQYEQQYHKQIVEDEIQD